MIASIVPAAGRSERMGRPKLILTIDGQTIISRLVHTLLQGGAGPIVVITPPHDAPGAGILIDEAANAGATVVTPTVRPTQMRESFELGLARVEALSSTRPAAVMLVPADSPGITSTLVTQLLDRFRDTPHSIVIPTYGGQRGHPIILPWRLALKSRSLPEGVGLNALVALHAAEVREIELDEPGTLEDLDTPEDYQRWSSRIP